MTRLRLTTRNQKIKREKSKERKTTKKGLRVQLHKKKLKPREY